MQDPKSSETEQMDMTVENNGQESPQKSLAENGAENNLDAQKNNQIKYGTTQKLGAMNNDLMQTASSHQETNEFQAISDADLTTKKITSDMLKTPTRAINYEKEVYPSIESEDRRLRIS